jgi:hypothetical protein
VTIGNAMNEDQASGIAHYWAVQMKAGGFMSADQAQLVSAQLEMQYALRWLVPEDVSEAAVLTSPDAVPIVGVLTEKGLLVAGVASPADGPTQARIRCVPHDATVTDFTVRSTINEVAGGIRGDVDWSLNVEGEVTLTVRTHLDSFHPPASDHEFMRALAHRLGWPVPEVPSGL